MKIGSFRFNLQEFAGSFGNYGTLIPLLVGYIVVCGMDPAGILIIFGLINIVTGLIFRLPLPLEPMKVLAVVAIASAWTPEMIYTSGIVTAAIWIFLGVTGLISYIDRLTPKSVVRGIQLSLGVFLAVKGFWMISSWWWIGLVAFAIVIIFRKNRYAPAALILIFLGIVIMGIQGELGQTLFNISFTFPVPQFTLFDFNLIRPVLMEGGLAQLPLTATNSIIATSALITDYWPKRRVTTRQLAISVGFINAASPIFGGFSLCHGAGGLAGRYYFGAKTGGANIIEGTIELLLGLLLAGSIAAIFTAFPLAIVGAMMFLIGIELTKFAKDLKFNEELLTALITLLGAVLFNMAIGFVLGLAFHYSYKWIVKRRERMAASLK